jgi:hypothetical protein
MQKDQEYCTYTVKRSGKEVQVKAEEWGGMEYTDPDTGVKKVEYWSYKYDSWAEFKAELSDDAVCGTEKR